MLLLPFVRCRNGKSKIGRKLGVVPERRNEKVVKKMEKRKQMGWEKRIYILEATNLSVV